jgi:hypothetical protein
MRWLVRARRPALSGGFAWSVGAPAGTVLQISAQNVQFDEEGARGTGRRGLEIEFSNNDAGVIHNVEILDASGSRC